MKDYARLEAYMDVSEEVREALEAGKPVVTLESTIISHGMPYPQNLETAIKCEEAIREAGAVPATTAIIGGRIKLGLTQEDLEFMAQDKDIIKTSTRDLAYVVSKGLDGATTVATSVIISRLGGVPVFVTGGIGGVHRGAEVTMDISRDLEEISSSNVLVVCAGCKSILDIGLTLEYLETEGVPVLGYKTKDMPAFFTQKSGYELDYAMESPEEIADLARAKWELGLDGGIVVGNPVPDEDALDKDKIDAAIDQALKEAEADGISGKEVTPYLLSHVVEATGGKSLEANIALVINNARLGGRIALALAGN